MSPSPGNVSGWCWLISRQTRVPGSNYRNCSVPPACQPPNTPNPTRRDAGDETIARWRQFVWKADHGRCTNVLRNTKRKINPLPWRARSLGEIKTVFATTALCTTFAVNTYVLWFFSSKVHQHSIESSRQIMSCRNSRGYWGEGCVIYSKEREGRRFDSPHPTRCRFCGFEMLTYKRGLKSGTVSNTTVNLPMIWHKGSIPFTLPTLDKSFFISWTNSI